MPLRKAAATTPNSFVWDLHPVNTCLWELGLSGLDISGMEPREIPKVYTSIRKLSAVHHGRKTRAYAFPQDDARKRWIDCSLG